MIEGLPGPREEGEIEVAVCESKLKPPPMHQVVIINDDFTPMDFVVEILMMFFSMNEAKAVQVMLRVHHQGKGICGVYTRDVAETKVLQVNSYARNHDYPLLCNMEVTK